MSAPKDQRPVESKSTSRDGNKPVVSSNPSTDGQARPVVVTRAAGMRDKTMEHPSFTKLGDLFVGRQNDNNHRVTRVVGLSEASDYVCLQHAKGCKWNHVSSLLSNYRAATDADAALVATLPDWPGGEPPKLKNGQRFAMLAPTRKAAPEAAATATPTDEVWTPGEPTEIGNKGVVIPEPIEVVDPVTEGVPTSTPLVDPSVEVVANDVPADDQAHEGASSESIPDGMALARFEGVTLAVSMRADGREALVRDLTLGERLGLAQPRNIRQTIGHLEKAGRLGTVAQRTSRVRYQSRPGVWQEREVTEYWLTEAQTLKVIARSDSDKAHAITDEMIGVFMAWRRGQFGAAPRLAVGAEPFLALLPSLMAETMKALVPVVTDAVLARMPAPAPVDPAAEADAETLRLQRANAAKKGDETKRFNVRYESLRATYLPLLKSYLTQRFERVDVRDATRLDDCMPASDVCTLFLGWLKDQSPARLPPEHRAVYRMLDEVCHGVSASRRDDHDGKKLLPLTLKSSARQPHLPGVSNA